MSDSDSEINMNTPPDIVYAATNATNNLLPQKSRAKYEKAYKDLLHYTDAVPGSSVEKGKVVPHAKELQHIISKFVSGFNNSEPGSLLDFILTGNGDMNPNMGLDTEILDATGIKKIVQKAWNDHRDDGLDEESMMWEMFPKDTPEQKQLLDRIKIDYRRQGRSGLKNHFGYQELDVVANMALRQMKQSIFSTKERLEATAPFRNNYGMLPSYQIALYTALVNLNVLKMDSYYLTMRTWYYHTEVHDNAKHRLLHSIHFLWFLIYYEKVLACNVDVTDTVRRIITLHQNYQSRNPAV